MWPRAVPYGEFGRLRREAPVAWSPDEGSGFWSVSRYADIVAASRDVADLVTFAIEAERAGLDAVMVSEHIVLGPSSGAAGLAGVADLSPARAASRTSSHTSPRGERTGRAGVSEGALAPI